MRTTERELTRVSLATRVTEPATADLELRVTSPDGGPTLRRDEPITVGVPLPRGGCADPQLLRLSDRNGLPVALQAKTLDSWADGSIRWVLLDFQADTLPGVDTTYRLNTDPAERRPPTQPVTVSETAGDVMIDTGIARFVVRANGRFPFERVLVRGEAAIDPTRSGLHIDDRHGRRCSVQMHRVSIEDRGPIRATVCVDGYANGRGRRPLLKLTARLHFFAGSATVRCALTVCNPRPARHRGGYWELGDRGSIYVRNVALALVLPAGPQAVATRWSAEAGAPFEQCQGPFEIYQESSGGENWRSSVHRNRHGVVAHRLRGYRLHAQGQARLGLRASPVVSLGGGDHHVTVAMKSFWQNFPKALETSSNALVLRLLPPQYPDVHEIQGGEQKTHEFAIAFGRDSVTTDPLAWYRTPLLACATPDWYCTTGVVPGLTPSAVDPNRDYLQLVAAALDGEDTLLQKREKIDEYGWRHFGDLYADHEAVHSGDEPLVSHYNNQYDAIGGFAYQFLRTGDPRWWRHMEELADHVVDIDIYHTHVDKSAYAQGLFWHTCHYADASLATHRSYPRKGGAGGGPSAEHNYTTGLMLHYFLSGSLLSRDSVIGLAQWVLDMDDGRKSIFRFLDRGDTGLANALYQGPSRGAGHSVNALLDGHRLTGNSQFLAKADQLIRRCSHPDDDIVSRNLLDAERRWSYTAFLQGLGKYLDYKAERGTVDQMYAYARLSLLRYAEWMVTNEYPYLERPEILEHPTETWAAQDMRKSEVFKYAAQHASDEERDVFLERSEFFFRYSTSTLLSMKTRTLVRPIVLMLSNGYRHAWFQRQAAALAPLPVPVDEGPAFGPPEAFVPQKVRALKRARIIAAVLAAVVAMLAALGLTLWTV